MDIERQPFSVTIVQSEEVDKSGFFLQIDEKFNDGFLAEEFWAFEKCDVFAVFGFDDEIE